MAEEGPDIKSAVRDCDPFQNIIELFEELFVPKIDSDKPQNNCDFKDYLSNECCNFQKIIEIIDNKYEFNHTDIEKYKIKVLTPAIIICGQHSSIYHWSSEDTTKSANYIISNLLALFSIPTVENALIENRSFLLKNVLNKMRPWLLKDTWKNYPAAVISYKWILEKVKAPNLSDHLNDVLPTALIITDDFECENKIIGLKCLLHIINEVGMTYLSCYSQDKVILKAIEPLFYYKDVEVVGPLASTFVALLQKYYPLKNRPVFQVNEFDEMIERFLINMVMEQRLDLREAYITALPDIVHARGLGMVLHSNLLISVTSEYVLEPTSSLNALQVLQTYIEVCWPRIQAHCTTILTAICKACLGLQRKRFSNDSQIKMAYIFAQLNDLCPNKVNPFLSLLRSHAELAPITVMLST